MRFSYNTWKEKFNIAHFHETKIISNYLHFVTIGFKNKNNNVSQKGLKIKGLK